MHLLFLLLNVHAVGFKGVLAEFRQSMRNPSIFIADYGA